MNDYQDYFDEVIEAHRLIEQWFALPLGSAALEGLLARFSPRFSMITPLGRVLDLDTLTALFRTAGGMKTGFRIELSELRGIDQHERGATVSYRERQVDATGLETDRRSTVVFEKEPLERVVWRHLHETFCES